MERAEMKWRSGPVKLPHLMLNLKGQESYLCNVYIELCDKCRANIWISDDILPAFTDNTNNSSRANI